MENVVNLRLSLEKYVFLLTVYIRSDKKKKKEFSCLLSFRSEMKRVFLLIAFLSVVGVGLIARANLCCPVGQEETCCAQIGKVYCTEEGSCRTRCLSTVEPKCTGCVNPEGKCCPFCPTAEVCDRMGKCQKIVDGCYQCVECDSECLSPKCLNEEGECCDSCPRTCPEGECLIAVGGCYECGVCPSSSSS